MSGGEVDGGGFYAKCREILADTPAHARAKRSQFLRNQQKTGKTFFRGRITVSGVCAHRGALGHAIERGFNQLGDFVMLVHGPPPWSLNIGECIAIPDGWFADAPVSNCAAESSRLEGAR